MRQVTMTIEKTYFEEMNEKKMNLRESKNIENAKVVID